MDLARKRRRVLDRFERCGSAVVALSGGVDSALLLALGLEALGRANVLAVTGDSPSLPESELRDARRIAGALGVDHEVVSTRELDRADYRANRGDRCFHCRTELFGLLADLADRRGLRRVVYGAIADDLGDDRPGMRAAEQFGVIAPLLEAGLDKAEVRALAAEAGLEVSDKPAAACLSSRIPLGTEVTPERLAQVERAETALRDLGFGQFRVRHHGAVARLELDTNDDRVLLDRELRGKVVRAVRAAGFSFVALDLEGYRTGSLNLSRATGSHRIGPTSRGGQ